ncbi:MAG: PQQ-binding-like beta-propeller repeat protein, partial [Chloroflexi bacterium]|nr:PQQ-binding-like beta-propeller repeat protein [Chloroflexota bacterium]
AGPRAARVAWKRPLAAIASSPVVGSDGTIYVGTSDGKLVAVAADGAAVKWTATTNDTGGSSPALATKAT